MMSKAMKPAAMKGKSSALIQISLDDDNVLAAANVDIGFSTKAALKSLERKSKGKNPDQKFMHFQNDCRAFFKGFIEKMIDRSPLGCPLTRYISCLNLLCLS